MSRPTKWAAGLVLAILLGIGFRLVWPCDIEYKIDEYYTFTKTKQFVEGGSVAPGENTSRWLGMNTSKGFKNSGMSLWVFYAIGYFSGVDSPPALARGVQVCNIAAILLLLVFAWRCFKGREREWWLWAVALVCVNPFAVLFERKIWPPSTLPLIMVAFLMCWRSRSTRWGALGWGLLGILAGQIHMAGFFYCMAFFAWTAAYDRRGVAWLWWTAGNLLGAIPMVPWIYYMANIPAHAGEHGGSAFVAWWRPFTNRFWLDWVAEPLGLGLDYTLGRDFKDFLRSPFAGGHATYGVAALLAAAALLGLRILLPGFVVWWKNRANWRAMWREGRAMFTTSALQAGFWFFGILLTTSCLRFERHYLVVTFPLVILWMTRFALPFGATQSEWSAGRKVLVALCVTNALITCAFLDFIHFNGGAPRGNYFKSYAHELQDGITKPPEGTNLD